MKDVAGVILNKNEEGKITHVTFDIDRHKDLIQPVLEQLGVVDKSKIRRDFENAMTAEQVRASAYKTIDQLFDANEKSKI